MKALASVTVSNRTSDLLEALKAADGLANPRRSSQVGDVNDVQVAEAMPAELVIYSDGLVDARGTSEEGWGCERLQQLLIRFSDESASTLMSTILSAVDQYKGQQEQFDDLTVMVWKWLGP